MEVRVVRTEEIRLAKEDQPAPNVRYYGRSESFHAVDSDPVWQILREYRLGDITVTTYANMGSFTAKWADRVSYFDVAVSDPSSPVSGTVLISGLRIAGRTAEVTITDAAWTALPATPLTDRNQLNLQNDTNSDIKIRYDQVPGAYTGVVVAAGSERQYAITDTIIIYAKAEPGAGSIVINVEELS